MAKLYFRYGAMGASKTANALMVRYNYEERGKTALLCKPALENRDGDLVLHSRMGLEAPCLTAEDLLSRGEEFFTGPDKPDCIIVDEAQFLTAAQVEGFVKVVDEYRIPVICYGLKSDFQTLLFEGSKRLLELADEIEEIPTICWCGKKARFNARYADGKLIREGETIVLGANESYTPLCRRHYYEGDLGPGI